MCYQGVKPQFNEEMAKDSIEIDENDKNVIQHPNNNDIEDGDW